MRSFVDRNAAMRRIPILYFQGEGVTVSNKHWKTVTNDEWHWSGRGRYHIVISAPVWQTSQASPALPWYKAERPSTRPALDVQYITLASQQCTWTPNAAVQLVALRRRTWQFLGSDPDPQSGYENEVFRCFLQSIQEHAANQIRPEPFHSTFHPIHYPLIIEAFSCHNKRINLRSFYQTATNEPHRHLDSHTGERTQCVW